MPPTDAVVIEGAILLIIWAALLGIWANWRRTEPVPPPPRPKTLAMAREELFERYRREYGDTTAFAARSLMEWRQRHPLLPRVAHHRW